MARITMAFAHVIRSSQLHSLRRSPVGGDASFFVGNRTESHVWCDAIAYAIAPDPAVGEPPQGGAMLMVHPLRQTLPMRPLHLG